MSKLHVLIGGGTGLIGRCLTATLRQNGHKVTVVSRQGGKPDVISWTELNQLGLPSGTNAIVGLSGEPPFQPQKRWTQDFKDEVYRSHIQPTKDLRKAALAADIKPKVFIGGSATGAYAPSLTEIYTETSKVGTDYLARMCLDWEEAAVTPDDPEIRNVLVRTGLVLSTEGGFLGNLLPAFKFGLGGPVASGGQYVPWIHVEDIAGIMAYAIENEQVTGVINGVSPNCVKYREYSDTLGKVVNRPTFIWVPGFAMNCLIGEERGNHLCIGHNVKPERTLQLGYKFKFPTLEPALRNLIT